MSAARGGDREALDRVLRALWPRAFRLAAVIVRDRAGAEEAAQDALVSVATQLHTLRDPAAYPIWSARIIVNAARTTLRRGASRLLEVPDERIEEGTVRFEDASVERLDVLDALTALPEWLRTPLVLRYVDDLTSAEIGRALGAPAATIRFRLVLARRRLAAHLCGAPKAERKEFA